MPFIKTHKIKDQLDLDSAYHEIEWVRYDIHEGIAMGVAVWAAEADRDNNKSPLDRYDIPRQKLTSDEMGLLTDLFETIVSDIDTEAPEPIV